MVDAWLTVGKSLRIPRAEVSYRATRAGGPGGQHVNKTASRVELWWNLAQSSAPTDSQRELLLARLGHRLDAEGRLRLVETGSRSQHRNRQAVTERFAALLERAVRPPKIRQATKVPAVQKKRRLEEKRRRGALKRLRQEGRRGRGAEGQSDE